MHMPLPLAPQPRLPRPRGRTRVGTRAAVRVAAALQLLAVSCCQSAASTSGSLSARIAAASTSPADRASPSLSLAGKWVAVSPDLYAMARVQFCVYEIVESEADGPGPRLSSAFAIKKADESGGCWGGEPCCGWWAAATGRWRRAAGVSGGATLAVTFVAANGTVAHETGYVQPGGSTVDLHASGQMFVRSDVSVWAMQPFVWLKTMTALTVRAARQTAADGTVLLSPGWPTVYGGQFVRDAFYGTAGALDLLPNVTQARLALSRIMMFCVLEPLLRANPRPHCRAPLRLPLRTDALARCRHGCCSHCQLALLANG